MIGLGLVYVSPRVVIATKIMPISFYSKIKRT